MTENKTRDRSLSRLNKILLDDILNASDEQILAEFKEDFGSAEAAVLASRTIFESALVLTKKGRLAAAKAAVAEHKTPSSSVTPFSPQVARRRLEKFLSSDPDATNKLTLAARKSLSLGSLPSDSDMQSMIEDLEELGIILPDDQAD